MEPEKQAPVSSVSEAPPAADPKGAVPPQVSIAQPKKAAQSGRALTCFIISEANDSYIAITVLEVCVVIFFIITYMLTLQHLLIYLDWPLLDLINSIISAVFLVVVAILTVQEKDRRHLFYVGGSLCLTAAITCIIDSIMVTKWMRNNVKKVLGIKKETKTVPGPVPVAPK
uniref:CKLF-like MARVEL transmembrane domain-containing protein 1 n=1 Tax=Microcebus murinus TaxID=30608 RepID=A0A8C5Y7K3_MICMU